ncbi:MAG: caspase family protein [Terriglobia bacterium]
MGSAIFPPNQDFFAFGSTAGIELWRTDRGMREQFFALDKPSRVISFADGKSLIVANNQSVMRFDPEKGARERIWEADQKPDRVFTNSDASVVASLSRQIMSAAGPIGKNTLAVWQNSAEHFELPNPHDDPWVDALPLEDGRRLITESRRTGIGAAPHPVDFCVWDLNVVKTLWCQELRTDSPIGVSKDLQFVAVQNDLNTMQVLSLTDGRLICSLQRYQPAEVPPFLQYKPLLSMAFSASNAMVAAAGWDGRVLVWSLLAGRRVATLSIHSDYVKGISFSPDAHYLLVVSNDGIIELWSCRTWQRVVSFVTAGPDKWATITPEGFYRASKGALDFVAFRNGEKVYPFEQFDLQLNRPDLLLQRLGNPSKELIEAYHQAYLKRLRLMGFNQKKLTTDFHFPEVEIPRRPPPFSESRNLRVQVRAHDSQQLLQSLNVYVNDIPIYGMGGLSLRDKATHMWEQYLDVELGAGPNKVQVSVLNAGGAESPKETFEINYTGPVKPHPDLYVVAVGVSKYRNKDYELDYAAKDAQDVLKFWQNKKKSFAEVHLQLLLDGDARREKILAAKQFLAKADVDDEVIVFVAGHGLLDDKKDFYFATVDMKFEEPSKRGVSYEALEGLLDGLKARKKLLLIDACQAGEVDKDEAQQAMAARSGDGAAPASSILSGTADTARGLAPGVRARAYPKARAQVVGVTRVGLNNSITLQEELFADLRRGSGAQIIAASGGMEFAYEGGQLQNGVFTAAVLEGLNGKASSTPNSAPTVSQLRDYVAQRVGQLTSGQQRPTVRRENLDYDFPLW